MNINKTALATLLILSSTFANAAIINAGAAPMDNDQPKVMSIEGNKWLSEALEINVPIYDIDNMASEFGNIIVSHNSDDIRLFTDMMIILPKSIHP